MESGLADYLAQTKTALAALGSPDPGADVASQKDYIVRARGVGLSPAVAANTIYALRHGFSPMMLQETRPASPTSVMESGVARDYIAVDMHGKKVWGPSKDYIEAKKHAQMAGGYVQFEPTASETPAASAAEAPPAMAADFDTFESALRHAKDLGWQRVSVDPETRRAYLFKQTDEKNPHSWVMCEMFEKGARWHIAGPSHGVPAEGRHHNTLDIDQVLETPGAADAKFERCVQHVKQDSPNANPWAVCHAALGREPEPFTKTVHWHRGDNGGYFTEAAPYGKIWVRNRPSDKKSGKMAWYAVVKRIEVVQGETRTEVSAAVEEHLKSPGMAAAAECARIRHQGDVDVIERDPACAPDGVEVETARQVHASMKERVTRLGHEEFYVIGVSKQGERVGQPVVIAMGEVDKVNVDIVAVVSAAANLRTSGAVAVWCAHNHPSNHGYEPSPADRDLTKRIRKAMDAIGMPFKGHLVLSEKHCSRA